MKLLRLRFPVRGTFLFFGAAAVFTLVAAAPVPRPQIFVGEQNPERVPALLTERDFLPPYGKGAQGSKKDSAAFLPRTQHSREVLFSPELTKYLVGSYAFLGDFEERQRPATPPGWILPKDNLKGSLSLVDPHVFERPKVDIILPVYRVLHLPFLKGNSQKADDSNVFRLNTAMNFWRKGDMTRAKQVFDEIAQDAMNATIPFDDPAVIASWAARGFFYLDILGKQRRPDEVSLADLPTPTSTPTPVATPTPEKKEGEAAATPAPPSKEELAKQQEEQQKQLKALRDQVETDFKDVVSRARDSFARVFYRTSVDKLFVKNARVDRQIFERTFDCPLFLEPRGGIPVNCERSALQRNMDPLEWVRATAVPVLWNAAVMQRQLGDWTGVFDNSDALAALVKRLDPDFLAGIKWSSENSQAIVPPPMITVSAPYGIWARNEKDMLAGMHFLRAFGMEKARDPLEILRNVDVGIRTAVSPELVSLGFLYAGNAYFDLHSYALARRTFAWCEASSELFSEKVPGCLLFGAESAFWEGKYEIAVRGFEKFIKVSADKEYVPWAYLRLALIAHLRGRLVEAEQRYAEIMRLYPNHKVNVEALVRNACMQIASKDLSYEGRRKAIAEVEKAVALGRQSLKLHAETCLLQAKFDNATQDSQKRSELVSDARAQLALLETYEKAFPQSPFAPLFEQRARDVKFAFVVGLADNNECEELEKKYEEQSKDLEKLGAKAKAYLPALEWGDNERKIVLRCSGLTKNLDLWAKLAKTKVGKDGGIVQQRLYDFHKSKQSPHFAALLAKALEKHADVNQWTTASREVGAAGKGYVRSTEFWVGISLDRLLRFDLSKPASQTRELRRSLLAGLQKSPEAVLGSEMLCSWAMPGMSDFSGVFWDGLAKSKKSEEWLDILERVPAAPKNNAERCLAQVAGALLVSSSSKPSRFRDTHVLRPYLDKKGVAAASDDWLAYVQRLARQQGASREVKAIYERLSKEGSSDTIKKVSKLWLDEHSSEN